MAKETYKCYGCKQIFKSGDLVEYASSRAKKMQKYCPKCLQEKKDSDFFSDKICEIFGIKAPGPLIYTQRKRIKHEYGYTDKIIIDCLEYIVQRLGVSGAERILKNESMLLFLWKESYSVQSG